MLFTFQGMSKMNDSILGKCWNCGNYSGWSVYCEFCGSNKLNEGIIIPELKLEEEDNNENIVDK